MKVSETAECGKAVLKRTAQKTPTPGALKRKRNYDTSIREVILHSSTAEKPVRIMPLKISECVLLLSCDHWHWHFVMHRCCNTKSKHLQRQTGFHSLVHLLHHIKSSKSSLYGTCIPIRRLCSLSHHRSKQCSAGLNDDYYIFCSYVSFNLNRNQFC